MSKPIICDTSIWLYLGLLSRVELLSHLYDPVYTTEKVCMELDNGRINRPDILDPRQLSWVQIVQVNLQEISSLPDNRLGIGEQSVLAYARASNLDIVGLDDRQARNLAHQLGLETIGTIGVLLKAKDEGLSTAVHPLLKKLQQEGFYISESLLKFVLQRAKED